MSGFYEDYQSKLAPSWLQGPNGNAIERTYGAEKDYQMDLVRQGLLSNLPGQGPADALDYIGEDRVLPPSSGESDNAYAERLRTVWDGVDGWSFAGSHGALLRALARIGLPMGTPNGCHIVQRVKRYSYLSGSTVVFGTHPGWRSDGSPPAIWNRFGLVFGADVVSLTVGSQLAAALNATVRLWKPAKALFVGTKIIVSGPTWGWPLGVTWGAGGRTWGGGVTRFIPP